MSNYFGVMQYYGCGDPKIQDIKLAIQWRDRHRNKKYDKPLRFLKPRSEEP